MARRCKIVGTKTLREIKMAFESASEKGGVSYVAHSIVRGCISD